MNNNGGNALTVSANGMFTFSAPSSSYAVTVATQPATQTCSVTAGTGTATANVTNVQVNCAANAAKYAYVTNWGGASVSQYTIGASGVLVPMSPASAVAGLSPGNPTVDPTGKYLYVPNIGDATVSQYTIAASGVLVSMGTVGTGASPDSVAVHPTGKYAYVANAGPTFGLGSVSQYTIGASGVLSPMTTPAVAAGPHPNWVTVDPSGKYAYVANSNSSYVSQYTIDPTSGALASMVPATVTSGTTFTSQPDSVAVHPSGKYAYVTNGNEATVSQYTINSTSGALASMVPATVTVAATPRVVTVDPSGQYAYVSSGANTVTLFSINPTTGALTFVGTSTTTGSQANDVTVDTSGKYVYVTNFQSNNVSQFTIGASGVLGVEASSAVAGAKPAGIVTTP